MKHFLTITFLAIFISSMGCLPEESGGSSKSSSPRPPPGCDPTGTYLSTSTVVYNVDPTTNELTWANEDESICFEDEDAYYCQATWYCAFYGGYDGTRIVHTFVDWKSNDQDWYLFDSKMTNPGEGCVPGCR